MRFWYPLEIQVMESIFANVKHCLLFPKKLSDSLCLSFTITLLPFQYKLLLQEGLLVNLPFCTRNRIDSGGAFPTVTKGSGLLKLCFTDSWSILPLPFSVFCLTVQRTERRPCKWPSFGLFYWWLGQDDNNEISPYILGHVVLLCCLPLPFCTSSSRHKWWLNPYSNLDDWILTAT